MDLNKPDNKNLDKKSSFKKKVIREIMDWTKGIAIALSIAYVINGYVIVNAEIPSPSMEGTIMVDDRVVASRLSYLLEEPERFDIIVFIPPDNRDVLYVKRVIGLPGELVELIDGKVYINGNEKPLPDSFIKEESFDNSGPYLVPDDSYFVMGDNRNKSIDSRSWVKSHYVPAEDIVGKVMFRYFPSPKVYSKSWIEDVSK